MCRPLYIAVLCLATLLGASPLVRAQFDVDSDAQFEVGAVAYRSGDYGSAFATFEALAVKDMPRAQTALGLMHAFGEGVPQSYAEAAYWYRRAADQGYAPAQYDLAELYAVGYGVPRDIESALRWMDRAARQGHARAGERLPVLMTTPGSSLLAPPEPNATAFTASSLGNRLSARSVHLTRALELQRVALVAGSAESLDSGTLDESVATEPTSTFDHGETVITQAQVGHGAFQVQVSAVRSQTHATGLLARLVSEHVALLEGLEAGVERADLGADLGVWYRVRLGVLPTRAAAEQFCERFLEHGAVSDCMPVTHVQ